MIIWGYNIAATCPDNLFGHWIIDLMKKGTKIIAIDPRLSWFASRSKYWLQIRPGTDAALALGFLHVIIKEQLYDPAFLKNWTNAPRLIRNDTGKLLRESDVIAGGSSENFVVFDMQINTFVIWNTLDQAYLIKSAKPELTGVFDITLTNGNNIACTTVWEKFKQSCAAYSPEEV